MKRPSLDPAEIDHRAQGDDQDVVRGGGLAADHAVPLQIDVGHLVVHELGKRRLGIQRSAPILVSD